MNRYRLLIIAIGALALAMVLWSVREVPLTDHAATATGERRVLYWYDPMHPDARFDRPGPSPFMDMPLVPKYADEQDGGAITIEPRMIQSLGVRTETVAKSDPNVAFEVVGSVEVDERRIRAVASRAPGWVERLDVRAAGEAVRRGQALAGIYSPELYTAQSELLLATRTGDEQLTEAARQRLLSLGVSERQLREVVESGQAQRLTMLVAPSNGIILELNAREGQEVAPDQPLMRVADLSRVWITIAIPEAQAGRVRVGARARVRLSSLPGEVREGAVEYVYPRLQADTRTLTARIALDNPELALKPGMYATVELLGAARGATLWVPAEAVIRTGTRVVVIVAEGGGRFRPIEVVLGSEQSDRIEIVSGLTGGEQVVVSGQFLIDSEASLRGAFDRMTGGEAS